MTSTFAVCVTAALATLLHTTVPIPHQHEPVNRDAQLMADFKARVDKYVEVRKKADDSAPPLKKTEDPAEIRAAQQGLVERIGAARTGAKQGDILTPEIADLFRRLVRPETKEPGTKPLMKVDKPQAVSYKINGPYPDKEPLSTMPPNVLASLPPLPKDIDYRFVGKHLILRDSRANSIIDYIPNVLP